MRKLELERRADITDLETDLDQRSILNDGDIIDILSVSTITTVLAVLAVAPIFAINAVFSVGTVLAVLSIDAISTINAILAVNAVATVSAITTWLTVFPVGAVFAISPVATVSAVFQRGKALIDPSIDRRGAGFRLSDARLSFRHDGGGAFLDQVKLPARFGNNTAKCALKGVRIGQ